MTAVHCPGHTPGEMVLLDDKTRTLLVGDACNCNLLVNAGWKESPRASVRATMEALEKIVKLSERYDHMYNSHHDYRSFGCELPGYVLTDAVRCMKEILDGTADYAEIPHPLSKTGEKKTIAIKGKTMVSFMTGNIQTECQQE